jgi:hypothetical protein
MVSLCVITSANFLEHFFDNQIQYKFLSLKFRSYSKKMTEGT